MKVLLTGFEPFGGEVLNPSYEAIRNLPGFIGGAEIVCYEIPTVFKESISRLEKLIKEEEPDIVLCIGQAGGRFEITLERISINIDDARIPDNKGNQPIDEAIMEEGEPAYFSNLPIKAMVAGIKKNNIPAAVSNSAGTFVCNHVMYGLLHIIKKYNLNIRGGFMHVPYITQQVIDKSGVPFMSIDMIREGIVCAITAALEFKIDIKLSDGKLD